MSAERYVSTAEYFRLPTGVGSVALGPFPPLDPAWVKVMAQWRVKRDSHGNVTLSKRGPSRFWKRRRGKR